MSDATDNRFYREKEQPTSNQALVQRLREHADLHDDLSKHSIEQLTWANDLRTAANLLETGAPQPPHARNCEKCSGCRECCVNASSRAHPCTCECHTQPPSATREPPHCSSCSCGSTESPMVLELHELRKREYVMAQHDKTGRYWIGPREEIPHCFTEVPDCAEGGPAQPPVAAPLESNLLACARVFHEAYCPSCPDHPCGLGDALADINRAALTKPVTPDGDRCTECGQALPPVTEWSMPACPECVEKADETRAARREPRPTDQREQPDQHVRCAFCDSGFLPGEVFDKPRECCEAGNKADRAQLSEDVSQ